VEADEPSAAALAEQAHPPPPHPPEVEADEESAEQEPDSGADAERHDECAIARAADECTARCMRHAFVGGTGTARLVRPTARVVAVANRWRAAVVRTMDERMDMTAHVRMTAVVLWWECNEK
jgi:hypothetical protein